MLAMTIASESFFWLAGLRKESVGSGKFPISSALMIGFGANVPSGMILMLRMGVTPTNQGIGQSDPTDCICIGCIVQSVA